jgi:hypothetical protein
MTVVINGFLLKHGHEKALKDAEQLQNQLAAFFLTQVLNIALVLFIELT